MAERVTARDPKTGEERVMPALPPVPIPTQDASGRTRWTFPDAPDPASDPNAGLRESVDKLAALMERMVSGGGVAGQAAGAGAAPSMPEPPRVERTAFNPATGERIGYYAGSGWGPL